jgi:hypothetical protein
LTPIQTTTTSFLNCPHSTRTAGYFTDLATKKHQKLPITRTDIQLEGKWTQFFIADDGNADKIIMFTTAHNLTNLASADIIYGDGT